MEISKRFLYLEPDGYEVPPWKQEAWSRCGLKSLPTALPYYGHEIKPAKNSTDPRTYLTDLSDGEVSVRLRRRYTHEEAKLIMSAWRDIMGFGRKGAPIAWTTSDGWLVFFVPHPVGHNRTPEEQLDMFKSVRAFYRLPSYHLDGFGSPHLIAALAIAWSREMHYNTNLFGSDWIRTDMVDSSGNRSVLLHGGDGFRVGQDIPHRACCHIAAVQMAIEVL